MDEGLASNSGSSSRTGYTQYCQSYAKSSVGLVWQVDNESESADTLSKQELTLFLHELYDEHTTLDDKPGY